MNKNNNPKLTNISKASTIEEIADFWDTHSLSDYWEQTHEVEFVMRANQRRRVTLTPEVYTLVESQARTAGVLPETLVNLWLVERLQKAGGQLGTKRGIKRGVKGRILNCELKKKDQFVREKKSL